MKIKEEQFELQLPRDPNRSQGLHLSDIIRDLSFRTKVLDEKYNKPKTDDDNTTVMQIGMAWENYLAEFQHKEILYHPGELLLDGIAMSPDGISVVDSDDYSDRMGVELDTWILHEFKASKKSSRDFKESLRLRAKKCLMWLWQVEAYRYAMNRLYPKRQCLVSKLHVLFLNGNYSWDDKDPESKPHYRIFVIEHTQEELETTWATITGHARLMQEEKAA